MDFRFYDWNKLKKKNSYSTKGKNQKAAQKYGTAFQFNSRVRVSNKMNRQENFLEKSSLEKKTKTQQQK